MSVDCHFLCVFLRYCVEHTECIGFLSKRVGDCDVFVAGSVIDPSTCFEGFLHIFHIFYGFANGIRAWRWEFGCWAKSEYFVPNPPGSESRLESPDPYRNVIFIEGRECHNFLFGDGVGHLMNDTKGW